MSFLTVAIAFVLTGSLLLGVINLLIMVRAFRISTGWGLAYLFVPLANLFFIIRFWPEVRRPVLGSLLGLLLIGLGAGVAMLDPQVRQSIARVMEKAREATEHHEEMQENAIREEERVQARELYGLLRNWQAELEQRRPAADAPAIQKAAFEKEHANYLGLLEEYKTLTKKLQTPAMPSPSSPATATHP